MIARNKYQRSLWTGRTVGLLGGSFNPAHIGHRHISLYAMKMLGLDAVWCMITPQSPMKQAHVTAPIEERLRRARHISHHPRIVVTDIEKDFGTRYTVDTLRKMRAHYPDTKFVWIMGSDNLQHMHEWNDLQGIFSLMPVCVLARPPADDNVRAAPVINRFRPVMIPPEKAATLPSAPTPAWTFLHIPLCDMSSTRIRENR